MKTNKAQILFEAFKQFNSEEVRKILDEKGIDPKVGIAIAEINLKPISFEGQEYYIYAARVMPKDNAGNQPYVTPHLHKHGSEPYYFLGKGEMNLGNLTPNGKSCIWQKPLSVNIGDKILIKENEIHSFRNNGEKACDFLFACPKSHLIDFSGQNPDGDRHIVKQLKNGIPPHYLK